MKQARAASMAPAGKFPSKPAPTPTPAPESMGPESLLSLQSSLTGGAPLPNSTRKRLESSFRTDLNDVRVHTGGAATNATNKLHADAFASGHNIAFAPGRFAPGTKSGDHLIAEEVAHVVQQRGSGGQVVQLHSTVSSASDSAEIAARSAADNIVEGKPANLSLSGLSTRGRIMRRARMGAVKPSPVVATPTNALGTTKAGPAPVLTPTMTSTLSPAGGKLVDSAGRKQARPGSKSDTTAKAPDEAQIAQPGDSASAPNVMTAGSPAGATADGPASKTKPEGNAAKGKTKNEKKEKEKDGKDKKRKDKQEARVAGGGSGGGSFGRVKGDRGAGAAAAAQKRLDERSTALSTNEGAGARIGSAQAAAAPPVNAAEAAGQQDQTGTLENADVPSGDPDAARAASRGAVSAATPGTIEDLEDFASPGGASQRQPLTDAIAGQADAQTGPVRASLSAVDTPPIGAAPPPAVPQPEPLPAPGSADPALGQAVPPPVNEEALDATEFKAEADSKLAEHDVDDATLQKADEGPLREIGNDKNTLNDKVDQTAGRARATETQASDTARGSLANAESGAQVQMDNERTGGQTGVSAEQDSTRTGEEQAEQTLADQINTTYQTAQTAVNEKLTTLTQDAVNTFRERQGARLESFASGVRSDLAGLKRRRYSGARGKLRKVRDWLLSINSVPEVQRLYQRHRDQYIADIDALITQIKANIDQTILDCKTALRTARETIEQLVADNADTMNQDAQTALTNAAAGFQRMEQQIDDAAKAAKRALDAERERAIQAMDAELDKIRSENAGLVDKLAAAISALAAALGQFMRLMTRVTRMGIGSFLSAALSQAGDGVRNNLWGELQEAFKQWLFMKLPVLQVLLSLPPNWYEMLTSLSTNMIGLFTENLPAMLPAIGTAAMIWLATTLASKLIPGVGAIMAVIDGIRGAYALVQSLFRAASAFFEFVMKVAERGNGAAAFARALAYGIVAAVDAVLTFLGIDRLIQRVIGAIARPFARIASRIAARFRAFMARRRRRRSQRRSRNRQRDGGRERRGDRNRNRSARSRAGTSRRNSRRRRVQRNRRRDRNPNANRNRRRDPAAERRRRQQERQRRKRERLDRAIRVVRPAVNSMMRRRGGLARTILRARLIGWRIRHRIRTLRLVIRGGREVIEAANSPKRQVSAWFHKNRNEIYRMVRDLARTEFRGRNRQDHPELGTVQRGIGPGRVSNIDHAGHELRARGMGGQSNTVVGGGRGRRGVAGRQYGDLTDEISNSGTTNTQLGSRLIAAHNSGTAPNQETAELSAIMFGAETARARRRSGGTAEITTRLAALGMARGQLGTEEVFGSGENLGIHRDEEASVRRSRRRTRSRRGRRRLAERRGVSRRRTGGLLPESMVGFSRANRAADRLTNPNANSPRGNTESRRDAEEAIDRTVRLVAAVVREKMYDSVDELKNEILGLLKIFAGRIR